MIIAISSPYRKSGLLYDKYKQHFGKDNDDTLVIQAATRVLNPTIDQSIIDAALAEDRAAASSEWLAQFRDDIGGYIDVALVENAVDRGVTVQAPAALFDNYVSFCDPSGGSKDSFTACVCHQEDNTTVVDCLWEIKAPFNPQEATTQICAMLKSYGLYSTTGDKYAASWVISAFAAQGITYQHSERDRSAIYADALTLFTSGRVRLLDHPRCVTEFASLERRTSPNGRDKIDHGVGGHDDLANACAGALTLSALPKPKAQFFFASVGGRDGQGSPGNCGGSSNAPIQFTTQRPPPDHLFAPRMVSDGQSD